MNITKEKLMIQAFERYGSIKSMELKENSLYFFSCDLKKITDDKVLVSLGSLPFIVFLDGFIVNIYNFMVDDYMRNLEEKEILEILNSVNSGTRYGRFYRDDDGDVTWEFSFEIGELQIEDISPYLISCAIGIKEIARRTSIIYEK